MNRSLSLFDIAKKGLRRKLFRSCAIAISVAIVAVTLFSITTIMTSVERSVKKGTARLGADIMVIPIHAETVAMNALLAGEPSTFYMDRNLEEKVLNVKGIKRVASQVFLKTLQLGCCTVGDVLIIAFDADNDFTIIPWLEDELKQPLIYDEVVIGDKLFALVVEGRTTPDAKTPSMVKLFGIDFTIVGILDETGMKFIDNAIFVTNDALRRITEESTIGDTHLKDIQRLQDKVSTILVRLEPEADPARVAALIEYYVPDVKAIVTKEVIASTRKQFSVLLKSMFFISIILWITAFLLIGVIFSMIVNERSREIGLLRAMGARKRDIFRLIMAEASILSVAGGILGIICGGAFLYFIREIIISTITIPYLWPSPKDFGALILICLALAFIAGTGATLLPAVRAARMEPYDAMRRGE